MLLLLALPGCARRMVAPAPVWEQLYEPAEEEALLAYAFQALRQAEELYAPAAFAVNGLHLRLGMARREAAHLSRADVLDWSRLGAGLAGRPRVWNELTPRSRAVLAPGQEHDLAGQLAVVAELNRWLGSGAFGVARRRELEEELPGILQPLPAPVANLESGLELCAEIPGRPGQYVLWLSAPVGSEAIYAQLGHETLHLLNNRLYDWYVEGLASVFSEQASEASGHSWQEMRDYFRARRESDPYAIAYWLMRELQAAAGEGMRTLLAHAVWTVPGRTRMHLDIDRWLASLAPERAQAVRAIIFRYSRQLQSVAGDGNHFSLPGRER